MLQHLLASSHLYLLVTQAHLPGPQQGPVLLFDCFVLFKWWVGNCSITESLPKLIYQIRQDLAGALEA